MDKLLKFLRTGHFSFELSTKKKLADRDLGLKDLIMVLYLCGTENVEALRLTDDESKKEARRNQVLPFTARRGRVVSLSGPLSFLQSLWGRLKTFAASVCRPLQRGMGENPGCTKASLRQNCPAPRFCFYEKTGPLKWFVAAMWLLFHSCSAQEERILW
jgi:hypothetical protein